MKLRLSEKPPPLGGGVVTALQMVRQARFDGDLDIIDTAEARLDALLDRLCEVVPA